VEFCTLLGGENFHGIFSLTKFCPGSLSRVIVYFGDYYSHGRPLVYSDSHYSLSSLFRSHQHPLLSFCLFLTLGIYRYRLSHYSPYTTHHSFSANMKLLEIIPTVILLLFVATVRGQEWSASPSSHPSVSPSEIPSASPSAPPTTERPSASPSDSKSPSAKPSNAPSSQPSDSTSPSSTPSVSPSSAPTQAPSDQPTFRPTPAPSTQPSFAPSFDPELPPNDRCTRAFDIEVNGPSEGWFNFKSSIGSRCRSPSESGPSVWYRFVGTGDKISIILCDNDADRDSGINIYRSRTGDCEDAYCGLNTRFTQSSCESNEGAGTTSVRSRAGEVYFIEVMTFGQDNPGSTGLLRVVTA
jgi:hypothetical protein